LPPSAWVVAGDANTLAITSGRVCLFIGMGRWDSAAWILTVHLPWVM
jgi:hypothetical protein